MSDIESTKISVRTLVICVFALVTSFGGILISGTVSVMNVDHQIIEHGDKIDAILRNQDKVLALQAQVAELQKARDTYRNFKWSTPMEIEYSTELKERNATLSIPDAQAIHDRMLPYTP